MPKHAYDEVLALFRNGAVAEAEEEFNALHARAVARQAPISARGQHVQSLEIEAEEESLPVSDGSAYYRVVHGRKHGPYCRHCYDAGSRLEKLRPLDAATYLCLTCKRECARNLCG